MLREAKEAKQNKMPAKKVSSTLSRNQVPCEGMNNTSNSGGFDKGFSLPS